MRLLYFVFSSSSRAPSSAATLGEKYRDELGKRTNEQRYKYRKREKTQKAKKKNREKEEYRKN